jgi:hypothetical protein
VNKGVKKTRHRMSDCRCYLSDVRFRLHVTYAHLGSSHGCVEERILPSAFCLHQTVSSPISGLETVFFCLNVTY